MLRECGFDLQRDEHNRFYIIDERSNGVRFSQEEAQLLKELVLKYSNQNKLKDSLLTKFYLGSEIQMVASHLVNAKNGKVIEMKFDEILIWFGKAKGITTHFDKIEKYKKWR